MTVMLFAILLGLVIRVIGDQFLAPGVSLGLAMFCQFGFMVHVMFFTRRVK